MGAITSAALYLGTPAASPPGAAPSPAGEVADAPRAAPVVFTLTVAARAGTLDEALAGEVRRDADARPDGGSLLVAATADVDDDGLESAVLAAHEARIALLERRIADAAGGPAAGDLKLRLRRAEAARRLAATRMGLAADGPDHRADDGGATRHAARPARVAAVTATRAGRSPADMDAGRPAAHASAPMAALAAARSVPAREAARATARRPASVALASARADPHRHASAAGASPERVADAAAHVRGLLAAARRALEADAAHPSRIELAGLLRWEGSETWSLAASPKRTA